MSEQFITEYKCDDCGGFLYDGGPCGTYCVDDACNKRSFAKTMVLFKEHQKCKSCAALQARIDALMLEYCPDEMTEAQLEEWGKRQVAVAKSDCDAIKASIGEQDEAAST